MITKFLFLPFSITHFVELLNDFFISAEFELFPVSIMMFETSLHVELAEELITISWDTQSTETHSKKNTQALEPLRHSENKYVIDNTFISCFLYLFLQHRFVWIVSSTVHLVIALNNIYFYEHIKH